MDQLQDQLAAENPELAIQIIGVNEVGQESANTTMTSGRDLPYLQDVDTNSNGQSDVWDELWDVEWRDVVIVDADQVWRGTYNLTSHDLADADNFQLVKSTAIHLATENPIWQNDSNPMDVNNDSSISPVGDVLTCINELNNHEYSDATGNLPIPAATSHPYFDVNGDYVISPVGDVLSLINHLNNTPAGEGEGEGGTGGPGAIVAERGPTANYVPSAAQTPATQESTAAVPELVSTALDSTAIPPRDTAAAVDIVLESREFTEPAANDLLELTSEW